MCARVRAYVYMSLNGFLCCGLDFSSSGACIFVCVCVCVCMCVYICMYVCIYIYTHTHILKRGLDFSFGFVDSIIGLIGFCKHLMPLEHTFKWG